MGTLSWVLKYKCIWLAKKKTTLSKDGEANEHRPPVETDSTGGSVWGENVAHFHGIVLFPSKNKTKWCG